MEAKEKYSRREFIRTAGSLSLTIGSGVLLIASNIGKVLPSFAQTRQVIAAEMQGHGHTADIDRLFTFEQMADDTAALLRYLKIERADFRVAPHPENLPAFHGKSAQRMLEFKDWRPEDIQSIDSPTLIMIGDADIVRPVHAVEMFRLLPHARLVVLPDTDHMTLVQRADWQVSMIETFLDAPKPKAK